MKKILLLFSFFTYLNLSAQVTPGGEDDPNAPIDGGVIGLLAAGAGVGYQKYKQKKKGE